jgi:hypothetical protein
MGVRISETSGTSDSGRQEHRIRLYGKTNRLGKDPTGPLAPLGAESPTPIRGAFAANKKVHIMACSLIFTLNFEDQNWSDMIEAHFV